MKQYSVYIHNHSVDSFLTRKYSSVSAARRDGLHHACAIVPAGNSILIDIYDLFDTLVSQIEVYCNIIGKISIHTIK